MFYYTQHTRMANIELYTHGEYHIMHKWQYHIIRTWRILCHTRTAIFLVYTTYTHGEYYGIRAWRILYYTRMANIVLYTHGKSHIIYTWRMSYGEYCV